MGNGTVVERSEPGPGRKGLGKNVMEVLKKPTVEDQYSCLSSLWRGILSHTGSAPGCAPWESRAASALCGPLFHTQPALTAL